MTTSPLRLLYAGQPETDRATGFAAFLGARFASVTVVATTELGAVDLSDVDVIVVDGIRRAGDRTDLFALSLGLADFTRPTVLMGGVGGLLGDHLGLKLGWSYGCLCLNHQALVVGDTTTHPLFSGPFTMPSLDPITIPSPDDFLAYSSIKEVPATVDVVEIGTPDSAATQEKLDHLHVLAREGDRDITLAYLNSLPSPGLVTTSAGFFDSPDCESIVGGINSKAHDYVAIGRQGKFLQWGFHAEATQLTELGVALFCNAIDYISHFADAPVEALRVQQPRDMLKVSLAFLKDDAAAERLSNLFNGDVPTGLTGANALEWFGQHRGQVRHVGAGRQSYFSIDPDLATIGIDNDDPALLDKLASDLGETGDTGERARALWRRYVKRQSTDATTERAWLETNREQLFFSDWGGYRWISRNEIPSFTPGRAKWESEGPVRGTLTAHRSDGNVRATVTVSVEDGFHLYAPGATDGIPMSVTVIGEDWSLLTQAAFPEAEDGHLDGWFELALDLNGDADALTIELGLQACDVQSCTPPFTMRLNAAVTTA